jgi:hypothetical protein
MNVCQISISLINIFYLELEEITQDKLGRWMQRATIKLMPPPPAHPTQSLSVTKTRGEKIE